MEYVQLSVKLCGQNRSYDEHSTLREEIMAFTEERINRKMKTKIFVSDWNKETMEIHVISEFPINRINSMSPQSFEYLAITVTYSSTLNLQYLTYGSADNYNQENPFYYLTFIGKQTPQFRK